ncbi:DUF4186 domain-containing protein [Methanococcus maripaludis]|uniref:DUF4186 domain-containing protein n=1 Tax=Methanococcus maripaludis TaxID=39152 RepID=A0A8T3VZT0_METMI|nr:DUF4186 domain-containing protein [Methanococcus maripaludis]MBG0768794.1 DUF4186 domain-containing protein [Methanococcus maripaludis]
MDISDYKKYKEIYKKLMKSEFRAKFQLNNQNKEYIKNKGINKIQNHAFEFLNARIKPESIKNDGKQTPMKGHPVFIAQHATATCCRGCVQKWHKIPKNKELSDIEVEYLVGLIMFWINIQMMD